MQYKMFDTVLVQEPKGIVPLYLVHLLKNNTVFLECARSFPWVRGLYAQYTMRGAIARNHLNVGEDWLYSQANTARHDNLYHVKKKWWDIFSFDHLHPRSAQVRGTKTNSFLMPPSLSFQERGGERPWRFNLARIDVKSIHLGDSGHY